MNDIKKPNVALSKSRVNSAAVVRHLEMLEIAVRSGNKDMVNSVLAMLDSLRK